MTLGPDRQTSLRFKGSDQLFSGLLNAGDFGGITINGHDYSMSTSDCFLFPLGTVPCAHGSVSIQGSAVVPFLS